jgi:mannan endo-1,4-beta-mannosidase
VNPDASPEAKKLLRFIYDISGKRVLSAQHNYPGTISHYTDHAHDITGKVPSIWGQDFGFTKDGKDGINHRQAIIDEAKKQYKKGSIITLMWHAVRPIDDEPNGWKESVQNHLTDAQWKELVTPGTKLHNRWLAQLDVVAGYLKQLRDANIPVIWRPYHEMNGNWFWWGAKKGPKGYKALYRFMFERFVKYHQLNNLIWVWNTNKIDQPGGNAGPFKDYYPGAKYVDILATDVYGNDYRQSLYDGLSKIAAGKPVALGEIGTVPAPAILDQQPRWAWFMIWCDFLEEANTHDGIRALYNDKRVLSRDELQKVYQRDKP